MKSFVSTQSKPTHKQRVSCLSKCITWSLSITLKTSRTTLSYQYLPKSVLSHKGPIETYIVISEVDSNQSSLPKSIDQLATQLQSQPQPQPQKRSVNDKSSIKELALPIENKQTLYQYEKRLSIIPLNNGTGTVTGNDLEDNFTFVIPIELDYNTSSPKEHVKLLREINNPFLNQEIYCNLNATMHNEKFLMKDIQFIIEPKRLVKSIQFRIERYKNIWLKAMNNTGSANKPLYKKQFFTMLIDNQSIGFEFIKKLDNIEVLPTNFNSIVNANIILSRAFLFIPIPKALILPKTSICKEPNQITTEGSNNNSTTNNNNNQLNLNAQTQCKSNSTGNSKLSLHKFFTPKGFKYSATTPVMSISSLCPNNNSNNNNNDTNELKRNKFSTFDFNDYTDIILSNSKISPIASKDLSLLNEDQYHYHSNYHHYTMTMMTESLSNNNNNNPIVSPNAKSSKASIKPKVKPILKIKTPNALIDVLLSQYPSTCNYLLFTKQCSLSLPSKSLSSYYTLSLKSFFNIAFTPICLFGLDVHYLLLDTIDSSIESIEHMTYFPTLSSMTLSITDADLIERILKEISNKKIRQCLSENKTPSVKSMTEDLDNENKTNCSEAYTEYIILEGLKVVVSQDCLRIEFIESRPPYVRSLLSTQIQKCLSALKAFESIDIDKVVSNGNGNNSWFCVSWNPHCINKDQRLGKTIFLAYYQFKPTSSLIDSDKDENEGNKALYRSIQPIGVLPIKYDELQWLTPISLNGNDGNGNGSDEVYDHLINRAMTNVEEYVYLNTNQTSIDYDFYLKSMMTKQLQNSHPYTSTNQQLAISINQ